jgi:hypothetical protein
LLLVYYIFWLWLHQWFLFFGTFLKTKIFNLMFILGQP